MGRKEVKATGIDSPLYFTMTKEQRLEFVKQQEKPESQQFSNSGLLNHLLRWVATGQSISSEAAKDALTGLCN